MHVFYPYIHISALVIHTGGAGSSSASDGGGFTEQGTKQDPCDTAAGTCFQKS